MWSKQEASVLWEAAKQVIEGIHSKGVVIMDLKPEHIIVSPKGLFIVDYGCSYWLTRGRPIAFMLTSPVFASVRQFTHFGNPVGYCRV